MLKWSFYLVLIHMYLFLWCFFVVKNCYKFSKWVYMGMGESFLLGILRGCPKVLQYTLLKFHLWAYFRCMLFIYLAILLCFSVVTLHFQITSRIIMDLLLMPNFVIALASYSAADQLRCAWAKRLELVFTSTLTLLFRKS